MTEPMTDGRLADLHRQYDGLSRDAYAPDHPATHVLELLAAVKALTAENDKLFIDYATATTRAETFEAAFNEVLVERKQLAEQLAAYLDGDVPPYRGVSIPDMTDADRVRALHNLLDTAIRLERRRRARYFGMRAERDQALAERDQARAELAALKTEWTIHVTEAGRVPLNGALDDEAAAEVAAVAVRVARPGAVVSIRSRLVGDWQPADGTEP